MVVEDEGLVNGLYQRNQSLIDGRGRRVEIHAFLERPQKQHPNYRTKCKHGRRPFHNRSV